MMYRIMVHAKRGEQEGYSYIEHHAVMPGKAQRLVDQAALAIARHEHRAKSSLMRFDWHQDSLEDVSPVTVYVGACEFHIVAVPLP
jgi:hypothetical protein